MTTNRPVNIMGQGALTSSVKMLEMFYQTAVVLEKQHHSSVKRADEEDGLCPGIRLDTWDLPLENEIMIVHPCPCWSVKHWAAASALHGLPFRSNKVLIKRSINPI